MTGASSGYATGILGRPGHLPYDVRRWAPPPALAWCVDRFWASSWSLPDRRTATARVLPHPNVNLTLEDDRLVVTGIATGVFTRTLRGSASVFGVKFRYGAFRPFLDRPVAQLSPESVPAVGVVPGAAALEAALRDAPDDDARVEAFTTWATDRGVEPDAATDSAYAVADALVHDPGVRRVADAARRFGLGERTLQRLFAEHVGVTPRWVLRRGRLHAAADRVIALTTGGRPGGWADVAADLGYVDQAHFSRDFAAVIGVPPGRWAAELLTVD